MKYTFNLLLILLLFFLSCRKDPQIQAAYDLIERITPGYGKQFCLELIGPDNGAMSMKWPGRMAKSCCAE